MQANYSTGAQTVTLPAGTFTLTLPGLDDNAIFGDLDITDDTTIVGAGADRTIIDGNGDVLGDRILQVLGAGKVLLIDLTLRNGKAPTFPSKGGAVLCLDAFYGVALDRVIVEHNSALSGGGVHVDNCPLSIQSSVIRSNAATLDTAVGSGGGLYVSRSGQVGFQLTIRDSEILSNTGEVGGGILFAGVKDGRLGGNTSGVIHSPIPFLLPLANNGGWTPTRMSLYPSPIANAGDPAGRGQPTGRPYADWTSLYALLASL